MSRSAAVHNPAIRRSSFRDIKSYIGMIIAFVIVAILALPRPAIARIVSALPTIVSLDFRVILALRIPALIAELGILFASTHV